MARTYSFGDLVTYSGATKSEVTNWVNRKAIRATLHESTSTGDHREFAFRDLFEACLAYQLNRLPGGIPLRVLETALYALRFAEFDTPWGPFVNPETRRATTGIWIAWCASEVLPVVVDKAGRDRFFEAHHETVVFVRLDTLLLDLEATTGDTAADVIPPEPSMREQIEVAIIRELTANGFSTTQVSDAMTVLRDRVNELPPALQPWGTFVRYVQTVESIVALRGAGPGYAAWKKKVDAFIAKHTTTKSDETEALDDRILQLVAARDAERDTKRQEM